MRFGRGRGCGPGPLARCARGRPVGRPSQSRQVGMGRWTVVVPGLQVFGARLGLLLLDLVPGPGLPGVAARVPVEGPLGFRHVLGGVPRFWARPFLELCAAALVPCPVWQLLLGAAKGAATIPGKALGYSTLGQGPPPSGWPCAG